MDGPSPRVRYQPFGHSWRTTGGIATLQGQLGEIEARASVIQDFSPGVVPGLLQNPAYTREMLTISGGAATMGAAPGQIDGLIAARLQRQQLLYTPGKRIQVVLGEAALRTQFGTSNTLAGQLDRLLALAGLDSVALGVLPFAAPNPVAALAGFIVHDGTVAWVETLTGLQRLDAPEEVDAASATGDEAVRLIRQVS